MGNTRPTSSLADQDNLTPFGFASGFGYALDDRAMVVLCVAGRFRMSAPGKDGCEPLAILDDQRPPPMVDHHWAAPGAASLQYAGQGVVFRLGTDVYL